MKPVAIKKVGIVGAGLMGGGIGMSCAEAGIEVVLLDTNQDGLDRGPPDMTCRRTWPTPIA